jgi:hypothetical protein
MRSSNVSAFAEEATRTNARAAIVILMDQSWRISRCEARSDKAVIASEAKQSRRFSGWIASSQELLAMTVAGLG